MKVLFHTKTLNYRGVTNSTIDYAYYNQAVLGNESVIIYNEKFNGKGLDIGSKPEVVDDIRKMFKLLSYESVSHLNQIASGFDVVYTQNSGQRDDEKITSTKHAVHAVFQYYQPNGDRYAYISEWLAKEMEKVANRELTFVPYVVNLPPMVDGMREKMRDDLGIPRNAFVFGRHGGYHTFDIEYVNQMLPKICDRYKNVYFLLANTLPRITHPRIIYMHPFFGVHAKTCFVSACDAGLHGRKLGESFGLGICEMLFHNKPVLVSEEGFDRNHIELVKDYNLIYNEDTLMDKIGEVMLRVEMYQDFTPIVAPYAPLPVMKKFKEVFLDY
jgi:hypothetical protein